MFFLFLPESNQILHILTDFVHFNFLYFLFEVSFGPISRCRNVDGNDEIDGFNMCAYFGDPKFAEQRFSERRIK